MTTLINPTDAQLNDAFLQKVAGELLNKHGEYVVQVDGVWRQQPIPPFTTSADAVLPWLEKRNWNAWNQGNGIYVGVYPNKGEGVGYAPAEAETFPRAAVIALLRAHGVQIDLAAKSPLRALQPTPTKPTHNEP